MVVWPFGIMINIILMILNKRLEILLEIIGEDKILASTFPDVAPSNFNSIEKKLDCIGIGSQIGQCKTLGNLLHQKYYV